MNERLYAISELAESLGTTPRAIRFYEDKGLVKPQRVGSNRCYCELERRRLGLVLRGKRLGLSLREIARWLTLYDAGPDAVAASPRLREDIERRLAELEQQRIDLETTLAELDALRRAANALAGDARRGEAAD